MLEGIHKKARIEHPPVYEKRFPVPEDKIDWNVDYLDYAPDNFTTLKVLENSTHPLAQHPENKRWADPVILTEVERARLERLHTSAYKKHLSADEASKIVLKEEIAGQRKPEWVSLSDPRPKNLFAGHSRFVEMADL